MQDNANTRSKTSDPVKSRELPKSHSQRKAGYLWLVETRIDGKRKRKFFKHDQAAKRDKFIADETARISMVAESDRAIVTNEALLTDAAKAHKALHPYGKTLADAVDFYVAHLQAIAKHDGTTLSTVAKRFLDEKEGEGLSPVHLADLKNRIARFELTFGDKPIGGISRNEIADWLNALALAPQSKINFRRVLGNLFSHAVRAGNIQINPVLATTPPKTRRKRAVILAPGEVEKLLTASPVATLPALALMVFCGIRNREMFRLDWCAVDWEDATIEIMPEEGKGEGHARFVDIPANAVEWLRPFAKKRGKIADFQNFDEYTRRLQDARAAAGWDVGTWPSNTLRKTFISCHYEAHGSIDETAKQAGTSVGMILKHYRKLIKKREAEKLWKIRPSGDPKSIIARAESNQAKASEPAQKTKIEWPATEKIQAMIWEMPMVEIARLLGVSDVAVVNHANKHGLERPPRGYWLKNSHTKDAR